MKNNRIPEGIYCYDLKGICPHWYRHPNPEKHPQSYGACSLLNINDWDGDDNMLWDHIKCCGINDSFHDDEFGEKV